MDRTAYCVVVVVVIELCKHVLILHIRCNLGSRTDLRTADMSPKSVRAFCFPFESIASGSPVPAAHVAAW